MTLIYLPLALKESLLDLSLLRFEIDFSFTMSHVVHKLALISVTFMSHVLSMTVLLPCKPLALVVSAKAEGIFTKASHLTMFKASLINVTITVDVLSTSMRKICIPIACVDSSCLVVHGSIAMLFVVQKVS